MLIRDMFLEDINRPINGVIKVDQDTADIVEQEVREYVITRELKKHFISFFNYYSDAFEKPTADIGVWISGFFGSGKSHFLKMLSYILENRKINGVSTVERFRKKFEDDPATFLMIDRATREQTETILFNIDIESSINKDKTAVLRVFAKMFYNHLGFYGENLKVVMLEQFIEQQGKTEEFRRVFEKKRGKSWLEQRKVLAFNGPYIIPTLMEVLDMSEEDAKRWFNDKTSVEFSIAHLVEDIKSYVDSKPGNFRLLFMVDEVGQYVGTDKDMLLNLQSLTEKLGSECEGKVWVVCTGQEAIDEIIKVRIDEFSRIQARFKTQLKLSSSSVDEVVQKRVLKKKPEAEAVLEELYCQNDSVLRNLFSFKDSVMDIKGFNGAGEFATNFPFVPYQFIIIQKAFEEIRKHGNAGKHQSGVERSMLSGFQEAAQQIQTKDMYALAPFFRFYDTVHTFLDGSIRRVIERCQKAAESRDGIEPLDVDVLKLLYLIRYVDDIPANLDNIVILMADDIRVDKVELRERVRESLNRLHSQNYIGRVSDIYNFLTDEEQDVQRDIKNTDVDTSDIIRKIADIIFADIYTTKKFRYGTNDFDFIKAVDDTIIGNAIGSMKLQFLTAVAEKNHLTLLAGSGGQAIVVLSDSAYYENLENAMKIRKYVRQSNVAERAKSVQDIIRHQQEEASRYEQEAVQQLKAAIEGAEFYVDGEHIKIRNGDAKSRINQALEYLVAHVYSELDLITQNVTTEEEIRNMLSGAEQMFPGMEPNRDAVAKVEEYLILQDKMKLPTSMADVQKRYQAVPYGWREYDIAAVVAQLIVQQKVTIKYAGMTVPLNAPKLVDMLYKKTEIGRTSIFARHMVSLQKMKSVKELLREYFNIMDVPDNEDAMVAFIIRKFTEQKEHYETLNQRYQTGKKYPDRAKVQDAIQMMKDILSQQKDNTALIDYLLKREDDLLDSKDDLAQVEGFFRNQVSLFDAAVLLEQELRNELDYLSREPEADQALNQIRLITSAVKGFNYQRIPELNNLMATVHQGHDRLLVEKREEVNEIITQCMGAIHQAAHGDVRVDSIVTSADHYYTQKRQSIKEINSLALLDGLVPPMSQYKDSACKDIEVMQAPPAPKPSAKPAEQRITPSAPKKVIKSYNRQIVFPVKRLENEADIDAYVEKMRKQLKQLLKGCDGIELK